MHRIRLLVAVLALALSAPLSAANTLDRIVAVVNDDVILASELDAQMAFARDRLRRSGQSMPPEDAMREQVLERLVLERIQLQRAEQRGISVDDAAVNNALQRMAQQNNTTLAGLRERLTEEGLAFERLREDVRRQLIVSRLRQREVASQVQISEREIEAALERLERINAQRTEYKVQHILLNLPEDAGEQAQNEARERAREVVERLRGGAEFATVASRVSDGPRALEGGDLGWRTGTSLPELFLDALRGLSPGAITDPVRSQNGFHILRLSDRRGGTERSITQFKTRQILLREQGADDGQAARERLAELRRRIRAGADFAELARAHSDDQQSAQDGGDMGWIGPGDVPSVFGQVLSNLEPGALSEPFRSPEGWHLVELLDQRERSDLEQYRRTRARRSLYQRQLEQERQQWRQRLRDEAYIEIRDKG